jgi:hypothetical protein
LRPFLPFKNSWKSANLLMGLLQVSAVLHPDCCTQTLPKKRSLRLLPFDPAFVIGL